MSFEIVPNQKKKTIYQSLDIYVINLKRSTDRREKFDKNNSKYIFALF